MNLPGSIKYRSILNPVKFLFISAAKLHLVRLKITFDFTKFLLIEFSCLGSENLSNTIKETPKSSPYKILHDEYYVLR